MRHREDTAKELQWLHTFSVNGGRNVEIQPPKLTKFRILAINLSLRGDSFAPFLRNSERLYASVGRF